MNRFEAENKKFLEIAVARVEAVRDAPAPRAADPNTQWLELGDEARRIAAEQFTSNAPDQIERDREFSESLARSFDPRTPMMPPLARVIEPEVDRRVPAPVTLPRGVRRENV